MKKTIFFCLLISVLAIPASAQNTIKMGFGIATNLNFGNLMSQTTPFYSGAAKFILDFNNFRLEPFFGSFSNTVDYGENGTTFESIELKQSLIGVNFEYLFKKENSLFFLGMGIGKSSVSRTSKMPLNNNSSSANDYSGLVFLPTIGGEYFFAPEFSAGIEINYPFYTLEGTDEYHYGNSNEKADQKMTGSGLFTYLTVKYFFAY